MQSIGIESDRYQQARLAFLRGFIVFLVLTALVAMISVISGEIGDLQAKILGTSFTISIASVCAMSCAAYLERKGTSIAGFSGIGFAFFAAALLIYMMWMELTGDYYLKSSVSLVISAFAFAHVLLLLLPKLNEKYQWVQKAMVGSVTTLATMGIAAIWFEFDYELYYRVLTIIAILTGLETIVIPLLYKIQSDEDSEKKSEPTLTLHRTEDGTYIDKDGVRYRVEEINPDK